MDLYAERGYDQTTVAEIAERAGLTERTFFRHYADKREVLFAGAAETEALLVGAVADAPEDAGPVEAVAAAIDAVAAFLQDRHAFARRRAAVIAANAELQERELMKMASWSAALAAALRDRGVDEPAASLTAELAVAVFRVAFDRWVREDGDPDLRALVHATLDELQALATPLRPGAR
jgi:AcrR family transcriptional regulator